MGFYEAEGTTDDVGTDRKAITLQGCFACIIVSVRYYRNCILLFCTQREWLSDIRYACVLSKGYKFFSQKSLILKGLKPHGRGKNSTFSIFSVFLLKLHAC